MTMKITLRDYQIQLKQDIYNQWNAGNRNVLAVSPTGSGKAMTLCTLAKELAYDYGMPTVIKVHRKELVSQLCMTLAQLDIPHNIIAQKDTVLEIMETERRAHGKQFYNPKSIITVVSVDTLLSRSEKYISWAQQQKVWILDEAAHQLKNNKWGKVAELFPNAYGVGFTATPQRLDKKGLGRHAFGLFDVMVLGPSVRYLIDQGYLSRYKIVVPKSDYNDYLQDNGSSTTDYTLKARNYASLNSHIIGDVVENYKLHINGKQAIVFADSIEAGLLYEKKFIEHGIVAKLITAETPNRERADGIENFRKAELKVLINVDLFSEGLDCLDKDTEILTSSGWKGLYNIQEIQDCYAWDSDTGGIVNVPISKKGLRFLRPDERMLTIKGQHIDIRVTEGHRIYWKDDKGVVNISTAAEIFERSKRFKLPLSGFGEFKGLPLSDDEIRIIAWAFTDGWIEGDRYLCISQSKYFQRIRDLFERLGWTYSERIKPKETLTTSYGATMDNHLFRLKVNPRWFEILYLCMKDNIHHDIHHMNRRQFKIFWDEMMWANGSAQKGKSGKLCTTRKHHADLLMHMASVRGYAIMYGNYYTKHNKLVYNLGIRDKQDIVLYQKDKRGSKFRLETQSTSEIVWCVTNKYGTLITRRGGKVAVLGNCPGVDAVIMARKTKSLSLYLQACGRALRPVFAPGHDLSTREGRLAAQAAGPKPHAIIIDHVGNIGVGSKAGHGLPDQIRKWTLDNIVQRRETVNLLRICMNEKCNSPFDRALHACPFCGCEDKPYSRSSYGDKSPREMLKVVDGDMELLDPDTIRHLEMEMQLEDPYKMEERITRAVGKAAGINARKNQLARIEMQKKLADTIALWFGREKKNGYTDRQAKKRFVMEFGESFTVVLSLPKAEMELYNSQIKEELGIWEDSK